jgi:hypothetical protein
VSRQAGLAQRDRPDLTYDPQCYDPQKGSQKNPTNDLGLKRHLVS